MPDIALADSYQVVAGVSRDEGRVAGEMATSLIVTQLIRVEPVPHPGCARSMAWWQPESVAVGSTSEPAF